MTPEQEAKAAERSICEDELLTFMMFGWAALEPGVDFMVGPAIETMARHLEAVTSGDVKRLLMNVPPGFTKSMMTNVYWPAWEWALGYSHRDCTRKTCVHGSGVCHRDKAANRYISCSYEKGLATRDLVRCRDLVQSEWYQSHWPIEFKDDENQKTRYETKTTGWRQAASVGSALTGHRGDRIIIDDPHSVKTAESEAEREESLRWFSETVPTRFNKQAHSAIVVIMQRLHERDISGLIIRELGEDYVHLCLPMEFEETNRCYTVVPNETEPVRMTRIKDEADPLPRWVPDPDGQLVYAQDAREYDGEMLWPERFPAESVEMLKKAFRSVGGTYAEAAQLQQRPVPRGGGMFQRDDFMILDSMPEIVTMVRGWDLAATKKGDWTAGVKLGLTVDNEVVFMDRVTIRGTPGEVRRLMRDTAEKDGHQVMQSVPQDPGQAGKAQVAQIAADLHGYDVRFSTESGQKEDRARPLAAQCEAGNVRLMRAAWNDNLLAEYCLFPGALHDDMVDAGSRAYHEILKSMVRDDISLSWGVRTFRA